MEQALEDFNKVLFELDHTLTPQNFTAEESVVGFLLAHPERAGELLPRLHPVDFEQVYCKCLWALAGALHKMGQPVTPHNLYNLVGRVKLGARFDEATGGMDYIIGLLENAPHEASVPVYLDVVAHTAYRRKVVRLLDNIRHLAANPRRDNSDLNAKAAAVLQYIQRHGSPQLPPEKPPRLSFSAPGFAAHAGSSPEWLVPDLILKGGLNLLAGEVGSGKTFLALDLAIATASGAASGAAPWQAVGWGSTPSIPMNGDRCESVEPHPANFGLQEQHGATKSPVLYLCLDTSRQTLQRRLAALCLGRRIDPPEGLHFDLSPLDLSQPKSLDTLRSLVKEHNAGLVILDALARYLPGIDENTVASISPVLTGLRSLVTSDGTTILLLHHLNKGSGYAANAPSALRIRGSSDILAAVDTALVCICHPERSEGSRASYTARRLIPVKNREQPESPPSSFTIQPLDGGGLRISFADPAAAPDTQIAPPPATVLDGILTILQQHPGQSFTRRAIEQRLLADGIPAASRTLDRAFAILRRRPDIWSEREGTALKFAWKKPPSPPTP